MSLISREWQFCKPSVPISAGNSFSEKDGVTVTGQALRLTPSLVYLCAQSLVSGLVPLPLLGWNLAILPLLDCNQSYVAVMLTQQIQLGLVQALPFGQWITLNRLSSLLKTKILFI